MASDTPQAVLLEALQWYEAHATTTGMLLAAADAHTLATAVRALLVRATALEGYARHKTLCDMLGWSAGPHRCTCGLDALVPPPNEAWR